MSNIQLSLSNYDVIYFSGYFSSKTITSTDRTNKMTPEQVINKISRQRILLFEDFACTPFTMIV